MLKTKKLFVLVFLLLNCILFSACSQSKEVDFVKKYKIDLNTISDVTEVLQKAIDELPDDGVLFLQDGTYPLAAPWPPSPAPCWRPPSTVQRAS